MTNRAFLEKIRVACRKILPNFCKSFASGSYVKLSSGHVKRIGSRSVDFKKTPENLLIFFTNNRQASPLEKRENCVKIVFETETFKVASINRHDIVYIPYKKIKLNTEIEKWICEGIVKGIRIYYPKSYIGRSCGCIIM